MIPEALIASHAPIFVCGTGRSGTTILQHLLSKHPRIFSFRYESRFLVHPGGLIDLLDHPDVHEWFNTFSEKILGEWYSRVYRAGTPREYVGGLCSDIDRGYIEQLLRDLEGRLDSAREYSDRIELTRYFALSLFESSMHLKGKTRFLEKTPSNILHMPQLLEIFPDAKLIHIIRDGRDVAASILVNGFWPINPNLLPDGKRRQTDKTVRNAAIFWRDFLEYGMNQGLDLEASSYLELRMEDLIHDPETHLRELFEHIEEEPDYSLGDYLDPSSAHMGRWREMFEPSDVIHFKEEAGYLLIELGYEPDDQWDLH